MNYLESLFSLSGRGAVVTGAARGSGRAMAEALLRAGARVVLADLLEPELNRLVTRLKKAGLRARAYVADVTKADDRVALIRFAEKVTGHVDILVNNAGITLPHAALDYPEGNWDRTYQVNLKAPFELSRIVARAMARRRRGVILNITSLNAELAFPDNPAYMACKGALKQLSKSLALDLGPRGIRVNSIGPGYFRTEMTRGSWGDPARRVARAARTVLGRWGRPEDLAGAVIFLASDAASYITGQDLYVDGGWLIKGL
ncbi:MAG: glucose 1-dehydrogenase [Verrucomicrobia bacterium]|nr:glucose 1-dehydrogenase [Verrucomicrobiota bacterium]MBU1909272.1 glucose 1-dehydrogenase [Verrucomicrobiota bacterium]